MNKKDIPILLLTFNRPALVEKQIERLKTIKPKYIYIASDGPRAYRGDDLKQIKLCRDIIEKNIDWNCELHKKFELTNLGCGLGVSSAISWFFENVEYGIILEDDCQVSESFFDMCSELIPKYINDEKISGIGADFKFLKNEFPGNHYGYTSFPQIWGWATWRRVWIKYDFLLSSWSISNAQWLSKFPKSSQRYWISCFNKIKNKSIDTWDYQFSHLVLSNEMLFIHPMRNMVTNVGFGEDATHTKYRYDDTALLPIYEVVGPFVENKNYKIYDDYLKNYYFIHRSLIFRVLNKFFMYLRNLSKYQK